MDTMAMPATRRSNTAATWTALVVSLAAVAVVAVIGSLTTDTDPESWYSTLDQPAWNPPDWLFAPVWTALYVLMAVAAWLVWRAGAVRPLYVYALQLALNLAWTLVFFGAESAWGGVAVITALWVAIVVTIAAFRPIHTAAAGWLVPYLAWVTYAAALNLAIALAS
jgi:tryptophan-rich sensory protein